MLLKIEEGISPVNELRIMLSISNLERLRISDGIPPANVHEN